MSFFLAFHSSVRAKSLHLCLTLCNPVVCSPPGFSFHGILQARRLEWVAIFFCRGSSQPRDRTYISCISCIGMQVLPLAPPGKPSFIYQAYRNLTFCIACLSLFTIIFTGIFSLLICKIQLLNQLFQSYSWNIYCNFLLSWSYLFTNMLKCCSF